MSSADTGADQAAVQTDERREALLASFARLLGDDLLESHLVPGVDLWIRIPASAWKRAHEIARFELGLKFFEFVSAIDWMPSPYGKSEDAAVDLSDQVFESGPVEQGVAGGETRFQVFSRLIDISQRDLAVIIKADVPDVDGVPGSIETIVPVFPGANWHEREIHEMFGIGVEGHPYLEKLYLPTGFEGNPLRKDFPLVARLIKPWPGIVDVEPMPGGGDEEEGGEE